MVRGAGYSRLPVLDRGIGSIDLPMPENTHARSQSGLGSRSLELFRRLVTERGV